MSTVNKNYLDYNGLSHYDEKIKAYIDNGATVIDWEDWVELTPQQQETGKWYVTNVPGSEPDGTMIFAIATTAWVLNTDSDAIDFPYVANISTQSYTNAYIPAEILLLGSNAGVYPTSAEEEAIGFVDKYIQFSTTGIRLRATDAPEVALTLVVRGSTGGSINASNVSYDNTNSGLVADDVQDAIDEIADNLDGFKFYPSGTAIVGLVADDSAYTDTNGNYVLANSTTGQSMIDDITYKSIASTEDTRGMVGADSATPFKRGGIELFDINPTQSEDALYGYMYVVKGRTQYSCYPVCGYDKVSIKTVGGGVYQSPSYCFIMNNGTETAPVTYARNTWTDFVQVPDGAIALKVIINYLSAATTSPAPITVYYSMLAKDSPYNV